MTTTILSVVDTREYEEIGDRWVPIPGSGELRQCERCGRDHEVHATVRYDDGKVAVVGTGCMGLGAEVGRRCSARASTLARYRAELAGARAKIAAIEAAWVTVKAMPIPPVTVEPHPEHGQIMKCADEWCSLRFARTDSDMAERRDGAIRAWQETQMEALGFRHPYTHSLRSLVDVLETRIAKSEAKALASAA